MKLDALLSRLMPFRASPREAPDGAREKYAALRRLTAANNAALEVVADLQRMATGELVFDVASVRDRTSRALALGGEVVQALAVLTDRRERPLDALLERLSAGVDDVLAEQATVPSGPFVLEFSQMKEAPVALVGTKIRRLAEIRLKADVPVPDGFSVTSAACQQLLAQEGLWSSIRRTVADLTLIDRDRLARASEDIRSAILATEWPSTIANEILEAHGALLGRAGQPNGLVSVRSSAVGEDGEFSFAGQYASILNVERQGLLRACREVVASQFSDRAVVYYKARGIESAALPMSLGVVMMVDATASGVLYTRAPTSPDDSMALSGSWGLGPSTVDGAVNPDVFRMSRRAPHEVLESRIPVKERMLVGREGGGVIEVDVPSWMRDEPCLTKDQIGLLASYGARLEQLFGAPQDVEWAVDRAEKVVVLQSRPLRMPALERHTPAVVAARRGLRLLIGGVVASPGIAAGSVSIVESGAPQIPRGAVIVARTAAPALAAIVDRASAIVTEVGSAACHLATVAREFAVPMIVNAEGALSALGSGQLVTVDAEMGNVYEGRIDSLLDLARAKTRTAAVRQSPLVRKVKAVLLLLAPLNLTDPRSRRFRASGCRTLHDLLRYAHERGVQEMFLAGGRVGTLGTARKLEGHLPLDFYIVDLGGGLDPGGDAATVTPDELRCRPLIALWAGLRDVPWSTAPAAGVSGFGSVVMTALSSRGATAERPEANFVVVTDSYVNIEFRFGYHFARFDASFSENSRENYASLVFHGGAADAPGRTRRLDFIAGVLDPRRWMIARDGDSLFGRIEALPMVEMARELEMIGRLLVVTRQLDTVLGDGAATARAVAAFRAGDYALAGEAP